MQPQASFSRLTQSRHDRVMALAQSLPILPTAISVPLKILKMSRDPKAPGLDEFAKILVTDGALSSKLLELANSAWFAPPRPITRVSDAVRMIGLKNLLPLLFGLSLSAVFNHAGLTEEQRGELWHSSLYRGAIARHWAKLHNLECIEEAFLAGVLQDMALPVMFAADRSAAMELLSILSLPEDQRHAREIALFGAHHGEFGSRIARQLSLPELYQSAVQTHHDLAGPTLPPEFAALAPGLKLAAAFPHGACRLDEHAARQLETCLKNPEFASIAPSFSEFVDDVNQEMRSLGPLAGAAGQAAGTKEFLYGVADRIARSMFDAIGVSASVIDKLRAGELEMQERIHSLETQVVQADYDDLSGVLKRRPFLERGEKVLNMARTYQMGAAVGFADLDNFKAINDHYGHEAGDRALSCFAKALRELIGNRGVAGRCGGDEFLFILVFPAQSTAAQVENEVLPALTRLNMTINDEQITVCTSIGLVWLGLPGPADTIQTAVNRADDLMYQAKRSTRTIDHSPRTTESTTRLAS